MKVKSIILTIIVSTFMISILNAQEKPAKVKEYGIGLSSFNSFSLQYRWGTDKLLYRLQGNIGANTSFGTSSTIPLTFMTLYIVAIQPLQQKTLRLQILILD